MKIDPNRLAQTLDEVYARLTKIFAEKASKNGNRSRKFNRNVESFIIHIRGLYEQLLGMTSPQQSVELPDGNALSALLNLIYSQMKNLRECQSFFKALEWIRSFLVSFVKMIQDMNNLEFQYDAIIKLFKESSDEDLTELQKDDSESEGIEDNPLEYIQLLKDQKTRFEKVLAQKKKVVSSEQFESHRDQGVTTEEIFEDMKKILKQSGNSPVAKELKELMRRFK